MFRTVVPLVRLCLLLFACGPLPGRAVTPPDGPQTIGVEPVVRVSDPSAEPVRLAALRVDAVVVGRTARTTFEFTLRNPNKRVLEGELQFPVHEGQEVEGFALDFDGHWRAAVPVDKPRGQAVFEDVTRGRVDPALLEKTAGNNFKLRIYPIPAGGQRRVSLTLSERLLASDGQARYLLHLPHAHRLDSFEFALSFSGPAGPDLQVMRGLAGARTFRSDRAQRIEFARQDTIPDAVVEIALAQSSDVAVSTERHGTDEYFLAELPLPAAVATARPQPRRIALVWDASGSGARRDHTREFALLEAWFRTLQDVMVTLTFARDTAEQAGSFVIRHGDWSSLRTTLEQAVYDGGTQCGAWVPAAASDVVALFSDGLCNFGPLESPTFAVPVLAIDAASGSDSARLRRLAEDSGGVYVDLGRSSTDVALAALRTRNPRIAALRASGARDVVASEAGSGVVILAGAFTGAEASVDVVWRDGAERERHSAVHVVRGEAPLGMAAGAWARLRIDRLEATHAAASAEIARLGREFGLVTHATSLIVLDRVEDYVRYEILPPLELRAEFDRLQSRRAFARGKDRDAHLEAIVARFDEKVRWWKRDFPKDGAKAGAIGPAPQPVASPDSDSAAVDDRPLAGRPPAAPPPSPAGATRPLPEAMALQRSTDSARSAAGGRAPDRSRSAVAADAASPVAPMAAAKKSEAEGQAPGQTVASVMLRAWAPDSAYARRLRETHGEALYRTYLEIRPGFARSTAFYLDVADLLFAGGDNALGLRVLSNLAEVELENREILRVLGYRLVQAGRAELALTVFERVAALAPEEPQSWRDLAHVHAALGQAQKAVDELYRVVTTPWHGRFPDIELIALSELNAIVARAGSAIDTHAIDRRLLRNLPLDVRAVLSWDADNTDIDLWVIDPDGEKAFYGHPLTRQGGRMSADFTGGYGPEEFSLARAKPGRYIVQAQFFGQRRQLVTGPVTLMLRLATGFGTDREDDRQIIVRLNGTGDLVTVGEFVVGEAGTRVSARGTK